MDVTRDQSGSSNYSQFDPIFTPVGGTADRACYPVARLIDHAVHVADHYFPAGLFAHAFAVEDWLEKRMCADHYELNQYWARILVRNFYLCLAQ